MKKQQFLEELNKHLAAMKVADADEVSEEYAQHFEFRLADGYSDEEICAKLGSPKEVAEQFKGIGRKRPTAIKRIFTYLGIIFSDIFAGALFILFGAWIVTLAAASAAGVAFAAMLIFRYGAVDIFPQMPYGCALVFSVAFLALSAAFAGGAAYCTVFLRQTLRSYSRRRGNILSTCKNKPSLPPVPMFPQMNTVPRRTMKKIFLLSLMITGVTVILSYIVCAITAGAFEFWHVWDWFV